MHSCVRTGTCRLQMLRVLSRRVARRSVRAAASPRLALQQQPRRGMGLSPDRDWNFTSKPERIKPFPVLGLGTWKSEPNEVRAAVCHALKTGYDHIDCAHVYGNHAEVGAGIRDSGVPRGNIWVTSKLWNTEHDPALVEPACRRALSELGLQQLDLFLIHWPVSLRHVPGVNYPKDAHGQILTPDTPIDLRDTWRAMERLVTLRLVRHIGVSNFSIAQLQYILPLANGGTNKYARYTPMTNQIEVHPYLPQLKLREFCAARGIVVTAYSPLGSNAVDPATGKGIGPLHDPVVADIARGMGCTPAQVLVRWSMQNGLHTIPKSVSPARIDENRLATTMQVRLLSERQMQRVNELHTKLAPGTVKRFVNPVSFTKGQPYFGADADDTSVA